MATGVILIGAKKQNKGRATFGPPSFARPSTVNRELPAS
jgi:hypothetical protein